MGPARVLSVALHCLQADGMPLGNTGPTLRRSSQKRDLNLLPAHLSTLVMVGFNKKAFKPQLDAIKDKYCEMFRNKSGKETRV